MQNPLSVICLLILSTSLAGVFAQGKNHLLLKCLVCQKVVEEIHVELKKVKNPNAKITVGGYHLDVSGNTNQKVVPYYQSDVYLNEVMDNVCEKMKDYVRARRKSDNKLIILPLVLPSGAMNPDFSSVNPIFDNDLNKSLGHYCQEVVNEYEEQFLEKLKSNSLNADEDNGFCPTVTSYCGKYVDDETEPPSPALNDPRLGLFPQGEKDEF